MMRRVALSCSRFAPASLRTCRFASNAALLRYSPDFGTEAAAEGVVGAHEPTAAYEREHRLKGGSDLGVVAVSADGAPCASAGCIAPGVFVTASSVGVVLPGAVGTELQMVESERVRRASDSARLISAPSVSSSVHFPSTRYSEGTLVVACGHAADGSVVVSPGRVRAEIDEDRRLDLDVAPLPLGGLVLDMANPTRMFGIMSPSGQVVSAKDPYFVVNWAAHCVPLLVSDAGGRIEKLVMTYVNDVKRSITRNKDAIPAESYARCQKVFVKNSVEDFKIYTL